MPNVSNDIAIRISWPVFLALAGCGLVLTFAFLKPGISETLSGASLYGFWAAHIFGALGLLQGAQILLMKSRLISACPPLLQILLSGVLGALPFTLLAATFDHVFGVAELTDDKTETTVELLLNEFTGLAPIVIVVWVGLNATRLIQLEPFRASDTAAPPSTPLFWARVPKAIGRDLVAISAELHYMRVHTTSGDALILFPFGKAAQQLSQMGEGLQIHRSHWVAYAHLGEVQRRGQGAVCITETGLKLPVSRKYRTALEAAVHASA